MTIINRLCPELSDIQAIQLECKHCSALVSYPMGKWNPSGLTCPNCAVTLVRVPESHSSELVALKLLAEGLNKLLNPSEELKFVLRLELRTQ